MEMKTRILLLGILSILYGLFVTDIKYPRIDELRCYIISLNVPMLWWQKLVQNGEMELKINFDKFKSKCVLYMFYIFNVFILFLILNFELELFLI